MRAILLVGGLAGCSKTVEPTVQASVDPTARTTRDMPGRGGNDAHPTPGGGMTMLAMDAGAAATRGRPGEGGAGMQAGGGGTGSGTGGRVGAAGTPADPGADEAACLGSILANSAVPACTTCLCRKDAVRTAACGASCSRLYRCEIDKCKRDSNNTACILNMCSTELSANQALEQMRAVPFSMCAAYCFPDTLDLDAGQADPSGDQ